MIFHPEFYNHPNDQSNVRKIKMFLDKQLSKPGFVIRGSRGIGAWNMPRNRHAYMLSRGWLFPTPWTLAHQALLSMGFSRKKTGVGCHFLLQGIFPTQESNPCDLHWQGGSFLLSHQRSPRLQQRKREREVSAPTARSQPRLCHGNCTGKEVSRVRDTGQRLAMQHCWAAGKLLLATDRAIEGTGGSWYK